MIITLISSSVVTHLHAIKDEPMSTWVESLFLHRMANLLRIKTSTAMEEKYKTKKAGSVSSRQMETTECPEFQRSRSINRRIRSPKVSFGREKINLPGLVPNGSEIRTCHRFYEESNSGNGKHDQPEKVSVNLETKWIDCADVVERMFFILWLIPNLASFALLMYLSTGNTDMWHTL